MLELLLVLVIHAVALWSFNLNVWLWPLLCDQGEGGVWWWWWDLESF